MSTTTVYVLIAAAVCLIGYVWRRRSRLNRED